MNRAALRGIVPGVGMRSLASLVRDRRASTALFWLYVVGHALVWFATPALSQPNGHRDVIEVLNWGKHLQWGYWKHPPLQPWVAEAFFRLTGRAPWSVYLASQLSLSVCFWAVWRFARDLLSPAHALLSVLLLEGVFYYNYNSPKFNHDALQLPAWALTIFFLWRALNRAGAGYWLLCGAAAGLGFLSKYSVVFLLVPLAAFVALNRSARRHLATPGPYLALVTAVLLVAPHVLWLVANDFSTIAYALARAERQGRLIDHLVNPLNFAANHLLTLVPFGMLAGVLVTGARSRSDGVAVEPFARDFLFAAAIGPFLAYLLVSAIGGFSLLSGWGTPLWSVLGVLALYLRQPPLTDRTLRRFGGLLAGLAAFWVVAFVAQFTVGPLLTGRVRPEHFPGHAVAEQVTRGWRARYGTPLPVVAGDRGFADSIGAYSPDRPDVLDLEDPDPRKSPWTSDADLTRRGGVIVWDARRLGAAMPPSWQPRFPAAETQPVVAFSWQTAAAVPPLQMGSAILPPAGDGSRPAPSPSP